MRQLKFLKYVHAHFLLAAILAMTSILCSAAGTHINQIEIKKESPALLRFEFYLNPSQLLHQLMAPKLPFPVFLKTYAELSESEFQKALAKAIKKLESESYVIYPSGMKAPLNQWKLPSTVQLQQLLLQNLLIFDLPPAFQSHVEPIGFSAAASGKIPFGRAQLFLSPSLFPVQVRYQQDIVWYTYQLPMSLFDF